MHRTPPGVTVEVNVTIADGASSVATITLYLFIYLFSADIK